MRLLQVIFLGSMLSLIGCATKITANPVLGMDMVRVEKGQPAPISGTLFSDFYLERYLQWKQYNDK
jgi:hypothetical protein